MQVERYELMTAKEAAQYLRISLITLSKIEKQDGIVPFRTPGGHRRYSIQMLNEYLGEEPRPAGIMRPYFNVSHQRPVSVDTGRWSLQSMVIRKRRSRYLRQAVDKGHRYLQAGGDPPKRRRVHPGDGVSGIPKAKPLQGVPPCATVARSENRRAISSPEIVGASLCK